MRVDDEVKPDIRVRFENVSAGENFYYQEKLCVKSKYSINPASPALSHMAVRLEDGQGIHLEPAALVIPARARVVVEQYGRFS